MQENIDIVRRPARRDVLQTEFQSSAHKIDNCRPFEIGVTISADDGDAWSDSAKLVEDRFCANIAKMPDFIGVTGDFLDVFRQTIVRVGQNENP
jgi:hypothetical protein